MTKKKEESKTPEYDKLSIKEKTVVQAYMSNGFNQVRAYLEAHPKTKYSSARVESSKYFAKPNMRVALSEKTREFFSNKEKLTDDLLNKLYRMAGANFRNYVESKDGVITVKDLNEIDDSYPIKSITQSEGQTTTTKITLEERTKAMELLGKFAKLVDTNIDLNVSNATVNITMPDNGRVRDGESDE
jgi:hypothetical protein